MHITFEESDRQRIIIERGLDLADALSLFRGPTATRMRSSYRSDCGRDFFETLGLLQGTPAVAIWTPESDALRVVTLNAFRHDPAGWIAPEDAPLWTKADYAEATYGIGDEVATRDEFETAFSSGEYKPPKRKRGKGKKPAKAVVTLRIPIDILALWRETGPGWQTRMVELLSGPCAGALGVNPSGAAARA